MYFFVKIICIFVNLMYIRLGNNVDLTENELIMLHSWISTQEGYKKAREIFNVDSISLSVRSSHVLESLYGGAVPSSTFLIGLTVIKPSDLQNVRNCGRKSIEEILQFSVAYRSHLFRVIPEDASLISQVESSVEEVQHLEPFNLQLLLQEIQGLSNELSTRSRNVVTNLIKEAGYNVEKLYGRISARDFNCRTLPSVGRKSYPEVRQWCEAVRARVMAHLPSNHPDLQPPHSTNAVFPREAPNELPSFIEDLQPLFYQNLERLTTRGRNAIVSLFEACGQSIVNLYNEITQADFSVLTIRNIGRNSYSEVTKALKAIKVLVEEYVENASEVDVKRKIYDRLLSSVLTNADDRREIIDLELDLGYFPFFRAVLSVIDNNLTEREHTIFHSCIRYREGQELKDLAEVGASLGFSRERCRQIRNKLIGKLTGLLHKIRKTHPQDKCPYSCLMNEVNLMVNNKEGTDFSLDFVHWIIGTLFDEYMYLGNPDHTFTTPFSNAGFIALVPSSLNKVFDFKAFIKDMDKRIPLKRMDDVEISLRSLIESHIRVQYFEEEYPEVERSCRSIIYLHYKLDVDYGNIIFRANSYKPLPDIIYDLIRKKGSPMTSEMITDEILDNYPERVFNPESVGSNALRHPGVIAVGRTGCYTLKEWQSGAERGGTIRDFVCEYLDSKENCVAPANEVCDYVRQFRPESSDSSISSNLMQETTHKFVILLKDGVRFFGYSDREYDSTYTIIGGNRPIKRSLKDSMRLLETFILENGRYPYGTNTDEEEQRLYRFVGNRRSACTRKAIPIEEIEQWHDFEDKYREYDIPRLRKRRSKHN